MSTMLGVDNAIGWAHWQVRGGWRNTLITTGAYFVLISVLIYFTVRANPDHQSDVLTVWRTALLALQAVFLVLFAGSRVTSAVRGDIISRMIESHRLMPVEPMVAISGYLWGPTSQAMALAVATMLIGAAVTAASGIGLRMWFGPNIVLVLFALFSWVVAAFAASVTKAATGILFGMLLSIWFSAAQVLWLLPGMTLLLTPLSGKTIFSMRTANGELTQSMVIAFAIQALIAIPLYIGAARKYRRSEDTALAILPAVLLLLGWVLASTVAIGDWISYFPENFLRPGQSERHQAMLISSIASAMLTSLAAVANAARDKRWREKSALVALAVSAVMLILCFAGRDLVVMFGAAVGATAVVLVSFTLGICYLLRIIYRVTARGWPIALGWIVLMWLIPLVIDTVRWALTSLNETYELSVMAGCSPIGALMIIWNDRLDMKIVVPGLIFQGCCAAGWAIIYYATQNRRRLAAAQPIVGG
jgi:hypothetical protein